LSDLRDRFRDLHAAGTFVMPNPWDIGTARRLAKLGFPALATTSAGHAASLGKHDREVTRDELLAHVATLTAAVDLPFNVDAERCFAATPEGVAETVHLLADAGAAGLSIEDYDPATGALDAREAAAERVRAAAEAAHAHGMTLTARAEGILMGLGDLDDAIGRLRAYRDVGADVVYAPLLSDLGDIARVVDEVGLPVNVLVLPGGPTVAQLAEVGVRRISTGSLLATVADQALTTAATELRDSGTITLPG
jgi:2-methylisocitrate lyase-like PEP mutase family enzyme